MKKELCHAFCNDIIVTPVSIGLAVSTVFKRDDGDRISFYVVDDENEFVRIEDDGATIPNLESAGVDFSTSSRRRALETMLSQIEGYFDEDEATIRTIAFPKSELPKRALDFVGVMIRMNDFLLLTQEKVASTFKEDATSRIREAVGPKATIREHETVSEKLAEVTPDLVIEANNRTPVAIFFGNNTSRVNDAIFLHLTAVHEIGVDVSVIALLENDNSIPSELRRRASNRLTTVPVFRRDEDAAVSRIVRESLGQAA